MKLGWIIACLVVGAGMSALAPVTGSPLAVWPALDTEPLQEPHAHDAHEVAPEGPLSVTLPPLGKPLGDTLTLEVNNRSGEPLPIIVAGATPNEPHLKSHVLSDKIVRLADGDGGGIAVPLRSVPSGYHVVQLDAAFAPKGVPMMHSVAVHVLRTGNTVKRVSLREWHEAVGSAPVSPALSSTKKL